MKTISSVLLLLTGTNAAIIVENGFECDTSVNWMNHGPQYSQISLTDGCRHGVCDANPRYGGANDNNRARQYCEQECNNRGSGCEGFFFQKHMNGHEICGFYEHMDRGTPGRHGHQAGAICKRV